MFQITILSRKFKFPALFEFSAQDSDLGYLFLRSKNPPVSSELNPPLVERSLVGLWEDFGRILNEDFHNFFGIGDDFGIGLTCEWLWDDFEWLLYYCNDLWSTLGGFCEDFVMALWFGWLWDNFWGFEMTILGLEWLWDDFGITLGWLWDDFYV